MGRRPRNPPAEGLDDWPQGRAVEPDVEHVRRIAETLANEVEGRSIRSVAAQAGITHQALADLLAGRTWPEVITIARIERGLGVRLWPE